MIRKKPFRVMAAAVLLAVGIQVGAGQAAHADATDHTTRASCIGYEASSISPPGTSDEEPGGAPQLVTELKEIGAELGVAPGAIFAFIGSLHEGSHEACDAALG